MTTPCCGQKAFPEPQPWVSVERAGNVNTPWKIPSSQEEAVIWPVSSSSPAQSATQPSKNAESFKKGILTWGRSAGSSWGTSARARQRALLWEFAPAAWHFQQGARQSDANPGAQLSEGSWNVRCASVIPPCVKMTNGASHILDLIKPESLWRHPVPNDAIPGANYATFLSLRTWECIRS